MLFLILLSFKSLRRISLQATLLAERRQAHTDVLSTEGYRDGDLFIYCVNDLRPTETNPHPDWRPYSVVTRSDAPRFLLNAIRKSKAERLGAILGLGMAELIERVRERLPKSMEIYGDDRFYASGPLGSFDAGTIGSR